MASLNILVKASDVASIKKDSSLGVESLQEVHNLLEALAIGAAKGTVYVQSGSADPAAASGTLTLNTVIATDVFTVGPVTFTGTDTPTTNLHFDTSLATDALIAADMARAVNEHTTASQIVTATSAAAVVTITAKQRGVAGTWIELASVESTITASAAYLAGGAGGVTDAESTHAFGE